jgi:hypothetical protein
VKQSSRLAALALALALGSAACATSINNVLADPSRYRDREVKISGRVADSYSVADNGVYRVRDGSGQLWVVSTRGVPRKDAKVTVRGTVREGFNLGGLGDRLRLPPGVGSGLVLMEISHKASR